MKSLYFLCLSLTHKSCHERLTMERRALHLLVMNSNH